MNTAARASSEQSQSNTIRVMIVDDHEVVRVGLATLLNLEPGFTVVGEASTRSDAVREAERLRPEVILMDIRLPDGSGIDACRVIRERYPECRVLFLTSYSDAKTVQEALRCDANGYLLKEVDSDYLFDAIRTVARGDRLLGSGITENLLDRLRSVTPEGQRQDAAALEDVERRMLSLIAEGKTTREIAAVLQLTNDATRNYLTSIYRKLEI